MKIKKIEFPAASVLSQGKEKFDYADSFEGELEGSGQDFDITQIGKAFLQADQSGERKCLLSETRW